MANEYTIKVYTRLIINSKKPTFIFTVDTADQVLVHIKQLFREGYRRVIDTDQIEWFPNHIIERIEASGPGLSTGYSDTDVSEPIT